MVILCDGFGSFGPALQLEKSQARDTNGHARQIIENHGEFRSH